MLHAYGAGVHDFTCDPAGPSSFRSSGLPDDFHIFMSDVLAGEPPITGADLDAMWAAEQSLRDAERELSVELDNAIRLNGELSSLLASVLPTLVPSGSAA